MHCKNLFYLIILCISYQAIKCNDVPELTQHSSNHITFGKPDEKFKVKPIFESLSEHVHIDIRTNDNQWHTDSPYNEQNEFPKANPNNSKYKDIPTRYMPIAVIGETIAVGMEWLSNSRLGCFLSNTFDSDNKPRPKAIAIDKIHQPTEVTQHENKELGIDKLVLNEYKCEFESYIRELDANAYPEIYNRSSKRIEAFNAFETNQQAYTKAYTLPSHVSPYLEQHSLRVESFEVCYGNIIQHQLHQEIIEIITTNYTIDQIYKEYEQSPLFADLVLEGADLARELNLQGEVLKGFAIADYCGWLNEAEYPLLSSIVKQAAGMVVGTVEGGCNIVKNTYNIVRHPIDTAEGLVVVIGQASTFLFHGVQELGPFAFHLSFYCTPKGYELHPHFAKDIKAIKDFYNQTAQELAQLPPEERARKITAFFTELYFTGKFVGQVAKIKNIATSTIIKPGATALVSKLQLYKYKAITQTYTKIASTVASTQDIIKTTCKNWHKPPAYSYELVLDEAGNWRWVYDINPTSLETLATECISLVPLEKTSCVLKRMSMTEIIQFTVQESAANLLPGIAEKSIIEYAAQRDELLAISRKIIESGPMKGKYLKIKIDHLFEAKINDNHFDGLHHDYLGHYENSGILELENRIEGKFGEYGGIPKWNGYGGYYKTFFPKHWTRQQVIENIYEAYDNFIASNIEPTLKKGKYRINGTTNSGLSIEMLIDQKGNLLSAYPII